MDVGRWVAKVGREERRERRSRLISNRRDFRGGLLGSCQNGAVLALFVACAAQRRSYVQAERCQLVPVFCLLIYSVTCTQLKRHST